MAVRYKIRASSIPCPGLSAIGRVEAEGAISNTIDRASMRHCGKKIL